jgi:hypothetical protein
MRTSEDYLYPSEGYARLEFLVLLEMNHKNKKQKVKSSDRPDRQRATPQRQDNVDFSNDVPESKSPPRRLASRTPVRVLSKGTIFCASAFSNCSWPRTGAPYIQPRASECEASQVMP